MSNNRDLQNGMPRVGERTRPRSIFHGNVLIDLLIKYEVYVYSTDTYESIVERLSERMGVTASLDDDASDFRPVHYLVQVGTGSCGCNCDWCIDGGEYDPSEDDGAVYDYAETKITEAFGEVPAGYFDDEEEEEDNESIYAVAAKWGATVETKQMTDIRGRLRTVYVITGDDQHALEFFDRYLDDSRYESWGGYSYVEVDE